MKKSTTQVCVDCFALIGIIQSSLFVKYLALIKEYLHPSRANFAWLTFNYLEQKGVGRGIKMKKMANVNHKPSS